MDLKTRKILEQDIKKVSEFFPKLKLVWASKFSTWSLDGELDICDINGEYWSTFEIIVYIPKSYPNGIPLVEEKSNLIPREIDRHISEEGYCCLDVTHKLSYKALTGIYLLEFLQNSVYPYFANQLYYNKNEHFAGAEYKHNFDGVIQFYDESLNVKDAKSAILILEGIILNNIPGRNDNCLCGSNKKMKQCHIKTIDFLKSLDKKLLEDDLARFKKLLPK